MIAIESAIVSQKRSSRRSPLGWPCPASAEFAGDGGGSVAMS
ncbi:MAG: hypothetical protein ACR2NR_09320 [Solirubrobacteraceae bacterium]